MLHFQYPLKLKTKRIVFEDMYVASDTDTLEQLKELSATRRLIEESINDEKAVASEMPRGSSSQCQQKIQKLENYLQLLENLVHDSKNISSYRFVQWKSNLKIRWTSALSASYLFQYKSEKFFQFDNLLYELTMMRFLYGALLREWANEVLNQDLVQSATLFRKAAGVYFSLAIEVLPHYQHVLPSERPPETTSNVSSVMSLICLAEAQAVTIKKAEEKNYTGSLLAKLHYGIVQMLDEATIFLHSANKEKKDISTGFIEYVYACRGIHELRSYKCLAENLKTDSQIGVALGVLQHVQITKQKNKLPSKELWRCALKQEVDSVKCLIRKYEYENNFVWNYKIPAKHELPSPEGQKIVKIIPYQPQKWIGTNLLDL